MANCYQTVALFIVILLFSGTTDSQASEYLDGYTATEGKILLAGRSPLAGECPDYSRPRNGFFGSAPNRFQVDKHYDCYRQYSQYDKCVKPVTKKSNDAYSWRCEYEINNNVTHFKNMNIDAACKKQYGPFAKAELLNRSNTDSWYCKLPGSMKLGYNRASYRLDLTWYCQKVSTHQNFRAEYTEFNGEKAWFCVNPVYEPGNYKNKISLADACEVQYGMTTSLHQRQRNDPNSYYCSVLAIGSKASASGRKLPAPKKRVRGNFDIERHGFNFVNNWKSDFVVKLPGFGKVNLGRTRYGLCGGMVYAAHDSYWYESTSGRKTNTPDRAGGKRDIPPQGSRLRQTIWDRQMDSLKRNNWHSVRKLYSWLAKPVRKVEQLSMDEFEKKVRPSLDKKWAVPLMIVITPKFGKNHQVLAVGYEWHGANNEWDIILYDPNAPDQETLLHTGIKKIRPRATNTNYQLSFRGFFVTNYRGQRPWWGPGVSKGPWKPGAKPSGGLRDPFGTGGKGPKKPETLPENPNTL